MYLTDSAILSTLSFTMWATSSEYRLISPGRDDNYDNRTRPLLVGSVPCGDQVVLCMFPYHVQKSLIVRRHVVSIMDFLESCVKWW